MVLQNDMVEFHFKMHNVLLRLFGYSTVILGGIGDKTEYKYISKNLID